MAAAPFEHALGRGQDRRIGGGQAHRDAAQVLEPAKPAQGPLGRVGAGVDIDGEHRGFLPKAQEQQVLIRARRLPRHHHRQVGDAEGLALARRVLDQRLAVPQRHSQGFRVIHARFEPVGVDALVAGAIQGVAGEGVGDGRKGHVSCLAKRDDARDPCVRPRQPRYWGRRLAAGGVLANPVRSGRKQPQRVSLRVAVSLHPIFVPLLRRPILRHAEPDARPARIEEPPRALRP